MQKSSTLNKLRIAVGRLFRFVRTKTDVKVIWTGVLSFIVVALVASWLGIGPRMRLPWSADSPDDPEISDHLPQDWRVIQQFVLELDGSSPRERVVLAGSPSRGPMDMSRGTILILAWDLEAQRWTKVFDASKVKGAYPRWDEALFDQEREPQDVKIIGIPRQGGNGKDLAISANMASGAGVPGQVVSVVRYESEVARAIYSFNEWGSGSIQKVGHPGDERLQIKTMYYTPVDAHCCPTRDYVFEVADEGSGFYEPVADNRPWAGGHIVRDEGPLGLVVGTPYPTTPDRLESGDVVLGLEGVESPREGPPGPYFLHQLGERFPGDEVSLLVMRNGQKSTLRIRLLSRLNEYHVRSDRPQIPYLGWTLAAEGDAVRIRDISLGGPAWEADIRDYAKVLRIGERQVTTLIGALAALTKFKTGESVPVEVELANGEIKQALITAGFPPADEVVSNDVIDLFAEVVEL